MVTADEIKRLRESKKMTQKALADAAGLSVSVIQALEQAKRAGSMETLQAIASATNTVLQISFK